MKIRIRLKNVNFEYIHANVSWNEMNKNIQTICLQRIFFFFLDVQCMLLCDDKTWTWNLHAPLSCKHSLYLNGYDIQSDKLFFSVNKRFIFNWKHINLWRLFYEWYEKRIQFYIKCAQSVEMSACKAFSFYQIEFECRLDLVLLFMNTK